MFQLCTFFGVTTSNKISILLKTIGSNNECTRFQRHNDRLLLWYGWRRKAFSQPRSSSEILTIANLRELASRIWICAPPDFRLSSIKLCSSNNRYNTAPQLTFSLANLIIMVKKTKKTWLDAWKASEGQGWRE